MFESNPDLVFFDDPDDATLVDVEAATETPRSAREGDLPLGLRETARMSPVAFEGLDRLADDLLAERPAPALTPRRSSSSFEEVELPPPSASLISADRLPRRTEPARDADGSWSRGPTTADLSERVRSRSPRSRSPERQGRSGSADAALPRSSVSSFDDPVVPRSSVSSFDDPVVPRSSVSSFDDPVVPRSSVSSFDDPVIPRRSGASLDARVRRRAAPGPRVRPAEPDLLTPAWIRPGPAGESFDDEHRRLSAVLQMYDAGEPPVTATAERSLVEPRPRRPGLSTSGPAAHDPEEHRIPGKPPRVEIAPRVDVEAFPRPRTGVLLVAGAALALGMLVFLVLASLT